MGPWVKGVMCGEWIETASDGINDSTNEARAQLGGSWAYPEQDKCLPLIDPKLSLGWIGGISDGFRVASSATVTNPTGVAPQFTSTNSFFGRWG